MYFFCTYFDHHYLPRGLTLYDSLKKNCPSFRLWILSLDYECTQLLSQLNLPEVEVIDIHQLEESDPQLVQARKDRTLIEYYFTCTPSLILHIFRKHPEPDVLTYLDADLFFFSDPSYIYQEFGNASIAIIEHRFPPHLKHLEQFGMYNVGYLSFRRDENANACLSWWRERCLEWCHDYVEETRFADQKYLNDWPSRFKNVLVFQQKGAGPGPWNAGTSKIEINRDEFMIDSQRLVVYHFHGLRILNSWLYETGLESYGFKMRKGLKEIYVRYLMDLRKHLFIVPQAASRYRKDQIRLYSKIAHRRIAIFVRGFLFEIRLEPLLEPFLRLKRAIKSL